MTVSLYFCAYKRKFLSCFRRVRMGAKQRPRYAGMRCRIISPAQIGPFTITYLVVSRVAPLPSDSYSLSRAINWRSNHFLSPRGLRGTCNVALHIGRSSRVTVFANAAAAGPSIHDRSKPHCRAITSKIATCPSKRLHRIENVSLAATSL